MGSITSLDEEFWDGAPTRAEAHIRLHSPTARCPECNRVFDLMDEDDADEYNNGHDCEVDR